MDDFLGIPIVSYSFSTPSFFSLILNRQYAKIFYIGETKAVFNVISYY